MDVKKAIQFMLISTISFACMNSAVKYLVNVSAYQIVFFRSVGSLLITMAYLHQKNIPAFGSNKKLLLLRSLVGVTSMTLFFMATKYIPIGSAVSLRYLAPIFAAIFSIFLLKDKVKHWQWVFFFISFSGVIILKGLDSQMNNYGLFLAVLSAVFSGLVYVVISKIGKSEHPVVVVNFFMFVSTIVGGLLSIGHWKKPQGLEWLLLFSLGVFGFFGQVFMTKAFQVASTNQVAPLKYLEVIFTVLIGLSLFGEIYTLWSILGMCMIILGLLLNVWYKSSYKA
ncbi:DMT family transporter [Flavobacteriaceae bacterium XHP0103]|uniref:DMT family transporter n=1 Tax=Marixanthotalea marina TaxID=2844359 RepID=UPI00298A01FC|nr:DMT family transporter [Marixanthotalea marina]MBU3822208.1 DMT family transporter [Marixanthotalea marina]